MCVCRLPHSVMRRHRVFQWIYSDENRMLRSGEMNASAGIRAQMGSTRKPLPNARSRKPFWRRYCQAEKNLVPCPFWLAARCFDYGRVAPSAQHDTARECTVGAHWGAVWQPWPHKHGLAAALAAEARSGRSGGHRGALWQNGLPNRGPAAGDARARLGGHQELAVSLPGGGHAGAGPSGGAFGRGAGHGVHTLRLCHSERRARSARSRRISSRARTESQRDVSTPQLRCSAQHDTTGAGPQVPSRGRSQVVSF